MNEMSIVAVLRTARVHLAGGWTGPAFEQSCAPDWRAGGAFVPTCRDGSGRPVGWASEGVAHFSVPGAIALAAAGRHAPILAAWDYLQRIVAPVLRLKERTPPPHPKAPFFEWSAYRALQLIPAESNEMAWFEVGGRTLAEVLRAFDGAIGSALRDER